MAEIRCITLLYTIVAYTCCLSMMSSPCIWGKHVAVRFLNVVMIHIAMHKISMICNEYCILYQKMPNNIEPYSLFLRLLQYQAGNCSISSWLGSEGAPSQWVHIIRGSNLLIMSKWNWIMRKSSLWCMAHVLGSPMDIPRGMLSVSGSQFYKKKHKQNRIRQLWAPCLKDGQQRPMRERAIRRSARVKSAGRADQGAHQVHPLSEAADTDALWSH